MAIERVIEFFKKYNMEDRIKELDLSSATVELAAKAIGCEEKLIAKSLSFILNDKPILIVTAGDAKIDNAKYKDKFKVKAKMIAPEDVEKLIGHKIGGVCPFGVNENVDVYLDVSLKRFNNIYPACGSSNSVIKLTIDELEKYSNSVEWIDVCKNWN